MNHTARTEPRPELVIRRSFDAPRELVYRMWTDPEHLQRWCCPTGFTITHSEGEIRVGGRFRTCMRSPEGKDHWLGGKYLELARPEKIAFTHAWEADSPPHETVVTITLEERDGKTFLTLHPSLLHLGGRARRTSRRLGTDLRFARQAPGWARMKRRWRGALFTPLTRFFTGSSEALRHIRRRAFADREGSWR